MEKQNAPVGGLSDQGVEHSAGKANVSQEGGGVKISNEERQGASNEMPTKAAFSRYTSEGILTKSFYLDNGELSKASGGKMYEGRVERMTATPKELKELLPTLRPEQALGFGIPQHENAKVLSKQRFETATDNSKTITRTKEHLAFNGPGIMMLDVDPQPGTDPLTRAQTRALLKSVWPQTANCPVVVADSASSHIYNAETGERLKGAGGLRVYLFVQDAQDIPRAGKALCQRLTLAGYGWIKISEAGTLLPRVPLDSSAWQPERLDFAAGAECVPPLEQRRPEPELYNPDAPFLDTRTMPDLTDAEQAQCRAIVHALKAVARPEAERIREQWLESRVQEQAKAQNVTAPEEVQRIRQTLRQAAETLDLPPEFELITSKGQRVTVKELLERPDKWHKKEFHDPLEPDYDNDPRIAVALLEDGQPCIYSHAHGGQTFFLKPYWDELTEPRNAKTQEAQQQRKRFVGLRRDDIMRLPELEWVIKGIMPAKGIGAIYGPSTAGKSFLALDMAACIAEGQPWLE